MEWVGKWFLMGAEICNQVGGCYDMLWEWGLGVVIEGVKMWKIKEVEPLLRDWGPLVVI